VEELLELVNGFAAQNLMLPRGPQYLFENVRDFVVIVDDSQNGKIVACGSLHVLWDDWRKSAHGIHPDYRNGAGRRLVEFIERRRSARDCSSHVHLVEEFARSASPQAARRLPPKVWGGGHARRI
jgi:amino-acid N-acetyltransferase